MMTPPRAYLCLFALLLFWGNARAQTCVIEAPHGAFEISDQTFTDTTERGEMYVNLCENVQGVCQQNPVGTECAVCQGGTPTSPHIELCMGYANGLTYGPLSTADYGSTPGFRVNMTGPKEGCLINREIHLDVLCAQPADEFFFIRDVDCVYQYQLKLKSCAQSNALYLVAFEINRRSQNSFMVQFIEPYSWMPWTYYIYVNDVHVYEGALSTVPVEGLEPGTPYIVSVYKSTQFGSIGELITPWNNVSVKTLGTAKPTPEPPTPIPTPGSIESHPSATPHSAVTAAGFFTGMIVAVAIVAGVFGAYTVYKRKFQNRSRGGSRGGQGFSILSTNADDDELAF